MTTNTTIVTFAAHDAGFICASMEWVKLSSLRWAPARHCWVAVTGETERANPPLVSLESGREHWLDDQRLFLELEHAQDLSEWERDMDLTLLQEVDTGGLSVLRAILSHLAGCDATHLTHTADAEVREAESILRADPEDCPGREGDFEHWTKLAIQLASERGE